MTNHDFASIGIETSDEWIIERTGIKERHIAQPGENTCSMAAAAACTAMERAGVHAGELDVDRTEHCYPRPTAALYCGRSAGRIRATRAAAFDLSAACSGWLYGMTVAEGMIASGVIDTALVVGSEKMSAIIDWQDRATCVLFGDGAGAVILQRNTQGERNGILSTFLRSDGTLANLLYRPDGGAAVPFSAECTRRVDLTIT